MQELLRKLREWYDLIEARPYREHLLILVLGLIVIIYFWWILFFSSYIQAANQLDERIAKNNQQISQLHKNVQNLVQEIKERQQQKTKSFLQQIKPKNVSGQDKSLFIDPKQMNKVLRSVVQKKPGIQLITLKAKSSTQLVQGQQALPKIYKQTLQMQFKGSYFDTLSLLKQIEGLPWVVFYNMIQYNVENYPKANVNLTMYLLTRE